MFLLGLNFKVLEENGPVVILKQGALVGMMGLKPGLKLGWT